MARRRKQPHYAPLANLFERWLWQLDRRTRVTLLVVLLVAGLLAAAVYYQSQRRPPVPSGGAGIGGASPNLLLGNPSRATADASDRANYLLEKPYFTLAYNDTTGTPNWVSW